MIGLSVVTKPILLAVLALTPFAGSDSSAVPAANETVAVSVEIAAPVESAIPREGASSELFSSFNCANRFSTSSSWQILILTIRVLTIQSSYPNRAGIAYSFVDCAGQAKYDRFWTAHDNGDRRTARRILRRWAANH